MEGKGEEGKPRVFKLHNGLQVFVYERESPDIVALDAWVATGAADEPAELAGASHFLEHMLFKGTDSRGPGELDRVVESVGGYWNAATGHDYTHYYVVVASPFTDVGLDALADALYSAALDPVELERERLVVIEEIRRKNDTPEGFLYTELSRLLYGAGHPYGREVLGDEETLSRVTRERLYDYHRSRYQPSDTRLFIVGKVDPKRIRAQVEAAFGAAPIGSPPSREPVPAALPPDEPRREVFKRAVEEGYLGVAFVGPAASDERACAVGDVTMFLLGEGRSCRLYMKLKEELGLATSISGYFYTRRGPGMCGIAATFEPAKLGELEEALAAELRALAAEGPPNDELEKAKTLFRREIVFNGETSDGEAGLRGYYAAISSGDLGYMDRYLANVAGVSSQDVSDFAKRWLDPARSAEVAILPSEDQGL